MAAQVEIKGDSVQDAAPLNKQKKFKLNRKTILIFGGAAVVLIVVIMAVSKRGGGQQMEAGGNYGVASPGGVPGGIPSSGGGDAVDMNAQLQSMKDALSAEVQSQFGQYAADLKATNDALASNLAGAAGGAASQYQQQMEEQMSKFTTMNQANQDALAMLQQQLIDQQARYDEQLYYLSETQNMTSGTTSKIDKQSAISLATKVVGGVVVNKNVEANRAAAAKLSKKIKAQQAEKAQAAPVKSPAAVTSTRSSTNVVNKLLSNNVPKITKVAPKTVAKPVATKPTVTKSSVSTVTKAATGTVAKKATVNVAANRAAAAKLAAKMKKK